MIKILYDVVPLGTMKYAINTSEFSDRICIAVCADYSVITAGINYLMKALDCVDAAICFLVGNDEIFIDELGDSVPILRRTGLVKTGLLRYELPKAITYTPKEQLPCITGIFDQYQSAELYFFSGTDVGNAVKSVETMDPSDVLLRSKLLQCSKLLIEKNGDDEIEITMPQTFTNVVIDAFIDTYVSHQ